MGGGSDGDGWALPRCPRGLQGRKELSDGSPLLHVVWAPPSQFLFYLIIAHVGAISA